MDLQALNYTRDHYNMHSNQYANTQDALRARASGPGAPLKKFHNDIKRQLINRFAKGVGSLLDLACGRGGDIWKWIDADIQHVKGVDLSPGEIAEARKRFEEARAKRGASAAGLHYEFVDTPALGLEEWREPQQYDAVTCMFAIHYFFVTEKALKQFLHNVSINLKEGGYFIGTVPDGKKINACIQRSKVFDSPMLKIEARWESEPKCFGSPYICAIGDTVTGGERGTEGSFEYLVYSNALVGVAAQYGLRPVLQYDCKSLEDLLDPADKNKALKHFKPRFPNSDPSLETASSLFTAFVFQKVSADTPAAGAPEQAAAAPAAAAPAAKRQREEAVPEAEQQQQQRPPQRRRPGPLKQQQQQVGAQAASTEAEAAAAPEAAAAARVPGEGGPAQAGAEAAAAPGADANAAAGESGGGEAA